MVRTSPRLRRASVATVILIVAAGPALADPLTPPPPPAAAGPQPMPYPNTGTAQQRVVYSADPMEGGQVVHSADPMEGGQVARSGTVVHKHIAGVKYEDFKTAQSAPGDVRVIEAQSVSWAALSSDPEEGGQVAREASKPKVGEINVSKLSDSSSAKLGAAPAPSAEEQGRLEAANLQEVAVPRVSGGQAKITTLMKACATGEHIKEATITHRDSPSYTLHDVTVTACNANADGETQTCTLSYATLEQ